jgi:DNA-binding NarL/FixJ family response regulator
LTGCPSPSGVIVAATDRVAGAALGLLLLGLTGAEEVAQVRTADELLAAVRAEHRLVLLDRHLRGCRDYGALLRAVRAAAPTVRIVVFASRPEELAEAGAARADAIVDQGNAPDGLRELLARLLGG